MEELKLKLTTLPPTMEGLFFMQHNGQIEPVVMEAYGLEDFYVTRIGSGSMPILSKFKEQLDKNGEKPLWSLTGFSLNEGDK